MGVNVKDASIDVNTPALPDVHGVELSRSDQRGKRRNNKMSCDDYIYKAPFPHCDSTVLHKPQECVHCDHYSILQNVRINNAIPFSGEGGSPDEKNRSREVIDRWGGNRAKKKECAHPAIDCRAVNDDGSFRCFTCAQIVYPKPKIQPDQSPDSRYITPDGGSDAAFDYLAGGDEVGCKVNLITGEHYGPCKGSCRPEKALLQALSEYLESEAYRWETEHTSHHPGGQCDFRDGVVSGYRWAKYRLDEIIETDESN